MGDVEEKRLRRKLERAREENKWTEVSEFCRRLALNLQDRCRYAEALDIYKEALFAYECNGDKLGVANANRMIGEMLCMLGQYEDSLKPIELYLEYSKTEKDKVEEQRALATIGRVYFCWATELKSGNVVGDKLQLQSLLIKCREAYIKSLRICENELKSVGNKERLEMKAKLLLNLGLALEVQGEMNNAQSYVAKAIEICKVENFYEDLHRCYLAQADFYLKQDNPTAAHASYDLAFEVTKRLSAPTEQQVVTLQHKAEAYFLMCNYIGAKNVLKKAYKIKSPNEDDKKKTKRLLVQAMKLINLEKRLSKTDIEDFAARKALYEEQGDACCAVKNYKHAIESYLNMLDCAQKAGETGITLLPCYSSLSQTYKDDKQYDLALTYCKKELDLVSDKPEEACKTYVSIGEILELKGADYDEISDAYYKAKELADDIGNIKQRVSALENLIDTQRSFGKTDLAEQSEKELADLKKEFDWTSDNEIDTESVSQSLASDLISDSDENEEYDRPRIRNQRNLFKIKRNEKGETQLHTAAINGNLKRARELIDQGHPVKVEDLTGWTPLHEACNHGHTEIVKLLLDHGADINDTGGSGCKGVTPLHDAASNGHFGVIDLLVKKGASTAVLTDNGETPLDCFKDWRNRVSLDKQEVSVFNKLADMLKSSLDKVSHNHKKARTDFDSPLLPEGGPRSSRSKTCEGSKILPKKSSHFGNEKTSSESLNLRRCSGDFSRDKNRWREASPEKWPSISSQVGDYSDLFFDEDLETEKQVEKGATEEYRAAMESVRKRQTFKKSNEVINKVNDSALLNENEYVDEWLEDDLGIFDHPQKKRKMNSELIERTNMRNKTSAAKINKDISEIEELPSTSGSTSPTFATAEDDEPDRVIIPANRSKIRRRNPLQLTLMKSGFQRTPAEKNEPFSVNNPTAVELPPEPPVVQIQRAPSVTQLQDLPCNTSSSILKVRVKVLDQILLIPIQNSKVEELSIEWLMEEASRRYYHLEGEEPVLRLKTKDGAILSEKDPLSLIYNEELESCVLDWKSTSLSDRYKEACASTHYKLNGTSSFCSYQFNSSPDSYLLSALEICRATKCLNLEYLSLTPYELAPVLSVLKHENNMRVLNLSGNVLGNDGLSLVSKCLEKCTVKEIYLSCNNITSFGVNNFCESLLKLSQNALDNVHVLDLSFNPLGDGSVDSLRNLIEMMNNLKVLQIDHCNLTKTVAVGN